MSENCSGSCDSCKEDCESRSMKEKQNVNSNIKKMIGVVSGKGGVGKSLVTGMLTVLFQRKGFQTAILDADVTGPSIPKMFGIKGKAESNGFGLLPAVTKTGIRVMSINLLLENDTDPVLWRGPILAGAVKQFFTDVIWEDVDFMFVDMPPGTGDVPLTVFQSLPLDGIVIVTSPQELVSMIVSKAVTMAEKMNIPILGVVENYSYALCPDCGKKINIFGESKLATVAKEHNLEILGRLPLDPEIAKLCDKGMIELFERTELDGAAKRIEEKTKEVKKK